MTRPAAAVLAAVLAVMLAGCVVDTPTASDLGTGVRPTPRTLATCDELVPAGSLDAFFTAPLELVGADRTDERFGPVVSDAWSTREAGGLACEWQSAASAVTEEGYASDYEGVRLRLLPATEALWNAFAGSDADARILECTVDSCELSEYSPAGWWLRLEAPRLPVESEARVTNAFDEIAARVAGLPAPTAPDGPHSGDAVAGSCDEQVSPQRVALATRVSSAVARLDDAEGFAAASLAASGGTQCVWQTGDGEELATVTVLPGAAWALAEAAQAHGSAVEVVVRGHESPGILRLDADGVSLDVALDGDWVRISVPDTVGFSVSPIEAATGIAIAVVAAAA